MAAPAIAAIIPLIIMAATQLAAAGVQAGATASPGKYGKYNRNRIKELLQGPEGLSSQEKMTAGNSAMAGIRESGEEMRRKHEAATGLQQGGGMQELIGLRDSEMRGYQDGVGKAAMGVGMLDIQRQREQEQELERRMAVRHAKRNKAISQSMEGVAAAGSTIGAAAGAPPTFGASGPAGSPAPAGVSARASGGQTQGASHFVGTLVENGWTEMDANVALRKFGGLNEQQIREVLNNARDGIGDPEVVALVKKYGG